MAQLFGHYYGVDVIGTLFTLLGVYLLGEKMPKLIGFVICGAGNLILIAIGLWEQNLGLALVNALLAGLNLRAYFAHERARKL